MVYKNTVSNMDKETILQERQSLLTRQDVILNEIPKLNEHSRTKLYKELEEISERIFIIMNYGK